MAGLASLASALTSNLTRRTCSCSLIQLSSSDSSGELGDLALQYFPETINDSKRINYSEKDIPGASLPIYNWVNSGARVISFTAVFTSDVDLQATQGIYGRLTAQGVTNRNPDIRSAIIWLRSFTVPSYISSTASVSNVITGAPRKLILSLPNTGIGLAGGDSGILGDDEVLSLMTQCDVTYEAFFPSGQPRVATVQLAFAQIGQFAGSVTFPQYSNNMIAAVNQAAINPDLTTNPTSDVYFGYTIPASAQGTNGSFLGNLANS